VRQVWATQLVVLIGGFLVLCSALFALARM
jgi:hypothetical protein